MTARGSRPLLLQVRAWAAPVARVVVMALLLSLSQVPVLPESVRAAQADADCPLSRPDRWSASVTARMCGGRVEVADALSETSRMWAEPNGSFTVDQALGIARFRRNNQWVDVNLTLARQADGSVAPAAHPDGLRLSGAADTGVHPLAVVGAGDQRVTLSWAGTLPEPVVEGTKATYPNVMLGVDLVIEATRTGFEQSLVVKGRAGLPFVQPVQMRLKLDGQSTEADGTGGFTFKDTAGRPVRRVAPALMWDAVTDGISTDPVNMKPVPMTLGVSGADGSRALVLSPDTDWLWDNARMFPITIDPYHTQNAGFDTYVKSDVTSDLSGSTKLALGTSNGGSTKRIAYTNFTTSGMGGAKFQWATLKLWATVATDCANGDWRVFGALSNAGTSTRWSNRPSLFDMYGNNVGLDGSGNSVGRPHQAAFGFSVRPMTGGCTGQWVEADATGLFQYAADHGWGVFTAALVPYWDDTNSFYKEFMSLDSGTLPHVSLNYSWPPAVTSMSTTPNTSCVTGSGRPKINTATPVLKAVVDDDESATVSAKVEWWNASGSQIGSATVSGGDATTLSTTVPGGAFASGGNYAWRVKGNDGLWDGAWSAWCEFTVDTAAPAAPGVSSSSHPSQSDWYQATTFAGTVSASDSSGIAGYAVVADGSATTSAGTTVTQAGTSLSIAAQPEGVRYVHVAAKDNAGNWSATTHYQFRIDTTKPGVPTGLVSSTHPVSANWYNSSTVTVSWTAPPDLSGVASYAVKIDQSATTVPATTDGVQTGTSVTTTVAADGVWFLHVRAKDNAGNWSDSAAHFTFRVDTDAPAAPELSSSSHPDQNAAYTSGEFAGSWIAPAGGAVGYSVVVDASPSTVPGTTVTTTGSSHTTTVAEGTWYLHVRAQDGASNWGATAHFRFVVDATAPNPPAVSSSDFPSGQWVDKVNQEGVVTFDPAASTDVVVFRYQLDGGAWVDAPVTAGQPLGVSLVPATDGPHVLKVKAVDLAGNVSGETTYNFLIGTGAGNLTGPVTGDITAAKTVLRAAGHASTSAVTFEWRRADTNTWATIPAGDVTFTAGGGAVTWPVATTGSGAYPELNWDVAKTINDAETGSDPLDGPLQVRAVFTGSGFGPSPVQKITFDKNLASAASASVGPGSVNLITGNYTLSGADVAVGGLGVSRVYNTRQASVLDPMFGPGWVSTVMVAQGSSPYTKLEVFGTLVQVGLPDGSVLGFTATGDGTTFAPPPGSEGITVTYAAGPNTYTVADIAGNHVVFGRAAADPAGQYRPYTVTAAASTTSAAMSWVKVTVDGVEVTRPTQVIAAAPTGVSCSPALSRGCRALTFTYAVTTTATSSAFGDYAGRVKEISYTAWDPATSAMATVVLARYSFDDAGKLRTAWDPRLDWTDEVLHHLGTAYAYHATGIVSTMTPPGQEPWQFAYTTLPADSGGGRLYQVSRSALTAGTATTTVVYRVPAAGAGAPYDLSPGQTARWGQDKAPTDATAIFPPNQIPDGAQTTGVLPSSFERAVVSYLDANARQLNSAQPGGYIDAVWFDQHGNTTQELTAGNRKRALDAAPGDTAAQEAALAAAFSDLSVYSGDGVRLLDAFGPEHELQLANGTVVRGRAHTQYTYDEGAPGTGGPFDLVTTQTTTARWLDGASAVHDDDARVTKTEYDWNAKRVTKSIVDPAGLNLATRTAYDTLGRVVKTTTPAGGSSDTTPSTRVTVYYTAAVNSTDPGCGNRPEWDGMVCLTRVGGQPASGAELPETTTTYGFYGQPTTTTESISTGTLRTGSITYDPAGRPLTVAISAPGLGEPLQVRRNVYDQATGQPIKTQTLDATSTVTAEIIRGYDSLGRSTSYTDADNNLSTTTYDLLSRPLVTNDGKATRTYTYDSGTERRGVPTSVTDSEIGLFTGIYDADGSVVTQIWPNGVSVNTTTNEAGGPVSLSYTDTGGTLYQESVRSSVHGQTLYRTSTLSAQGYGYDPAGRLTSVADTVIGECTTRAYSFDTATNRTEQTTYSQATGGACQTATASGATTWTFDTADRASTAGYTYDTLGRTLTMPGTDTAIASGGTATMTYHVNDMAHSISQGTRTATYTLDVITNRFRTWTDNPSGNPITKINHFAGDIDSPVWTDESSSTWTRQIAGLSGIVAVHTATAGENYLLANLNGDFIATMPETGSGITFTGEYTENGQPRNTPSTGTQRYGWLGSAQRPADSPAGMVLMGARLYTPGIGRFLSVDPVYGGSCNAYEYVCADPTNKSDLDGRCIGWFLRFCTFTTHQVVRVSKARSNPVIRGYVRRLVGCGFGSPCDRAKVNEGYVTFVRWYCGLSSIVRAWIGAFGFAIGFITAGIPLAASIVILELTCAYRVELKI